MATLGAPIVLILVGGAALRRLLGEAYINDEEAILEYSQVTWDEVWQRPQQYAWIASREFPVVYCCPVQLHNLLYLGTKWRPVRRINQDGRRLLILSPLIFSGHFKFRLINRINCRITAIHLRMAMAAKTGIYVLLNTPFGFPVLERYFYDNGNRPARLLRLTYDVIDDFTVFDWSPDFGKALDDKMMREADVVITGTNELAELRPGAKFIQCGVDYELFSTAQQMPSDIKDLPQPILGYFGTISERIDLELIARLADAFPGGSIVMIGPVHLPANQLPLRPNIHYLGLRRHSELPAYAQAFDVGLIPFRITPATVKLNPVKTLEYLAAGLPVVATRLPDLDRFYADVVGIADSHEDYVAAVQNVVEQQDQNRIAAGVDIARGASWERMVERINNVLFTEDSHGKEVKNSTELNLP